MAKYDVLPQDPAHIPVKPRCCGISQRKLIATSIITILIIILALYTLCRSSEKGTVIIKDLLADNDRPDYNRPKHRLPHCIIIGMRKGGTRALLSFLSLHPDIQVSGKEIHYFDRDTNFFQGINWYKKNLPLSYGDQITIEKTPAYFHTKDTPQRIFQMNNTMKLILVVREPIERTVSDHLQLMEKRAKQGLETFRFEEKAIKNGKVNVNYKPIDRSVYHQHMKHWLKYFPLEQILVLDGKNLIKNPFRVIQTVESYLGLEHKISKDSFVFDRTKGFFCIKNETTGHKCLNKNKGRKHPKIDPVVIEKLRNYFKPNNAIFFEQVGQTFQW